MTSWYRTLKKLSGQYDMISLKPISNIYSPSSKKKIEILWNPTRKELRDFARGNKTLRAFIFPKANKVLVWNSFQAAHFQIAEVLSEAFPEIQKAIPIYIYPNGVVVSQFSKKTKWEENPKTKNTILNTEAVQNMFGESPKINYYNEAITGPWEE